MEKTWEVRSMDKADTDEAVAAARRARQTTAAWLTDAIREKIAREREPIGGEVLAPSAMLVPIADSAPPLSALELVQNLEAYERVMRLRGKPISPRGRVLVAAERHLRARLIAIALTRSPDVSGSSVPTHTATRLESQVQHE